MWKGSGWEGTCWEDGRGDREWRRGAGVKSVATTGYKVRWLTLAAGQISPRRGEVKGHPGWLPLMRFLRAGSSYQRAPETEDARLEQVAREIV